MCTNDTQQFIFIIVDFFFLISKFHCSVTLGTFIFIMIYI